MRDRLIELLKALRKTPEVACPQFNKGCEGCQFIEGELCDIEGREADYLLKNGVIVPPDELYSIVDKGTIYATVSKAMVDWLPLYVIKEPEEYGYYKTREQAEAKLKEGGKE